MTILSESGARRLGGGATLSLGGFPVPTEDTHRVADADLTIGGITYDGMVVALDVQMNGRNYMAALDLGTPTPIVNQPVFDQQELRTCVR